MKKKREKNTEPILKKTKVARGVSGKKNCFRGEVACNNSCAGKTLKTEVFVLK